MNLSYWEKDIYFSNIDVLIIGSGIVGLSTALELKRKDNSLKIVVLERGILPMGASSKNAGFSCFGSVTELLEDLTKDSEENVYKLVQKRWKGLQRLRENLGDQGIELIQKGGYELFDQEEIFENCASKIDYLNNLVKDAIGSTEVYKIVDHKIANFGFNNVSHLIENTFEGQINTGKMISNLIRKVQQEGVLILNGMEVKHIDENETNVHIQLVSGFSFEVNKVVVATNGFAKQLLPELDVQPARAQVLITNEIPNLKVEGTFHYDAGYYYFRNINSRILFGGGRNLDFKGEETTEMVISELIQNKLDEILREVILPNTSYTIDQRWSGVMGVGQTKSTIVKNISNNVYCAVRMGGMGVAIGSLIGQVVTDLIFEG